MKYESQNITPAWMEREEQRFAQGEYERLPDSVIVLLSQHKFTLDPFHFAHRSKKKRGWISFTPVHQYGKQDRQLSIPFSKYLSRYSILPSHIIGEANALMNLECGAVGFSILRDRDAIRQAYENGPPSCMSKPARRFSDLGIHPTEVYASPDCGLAIIRGADDIVSQRCVLNMKDKLYGRIYGSGPLDVVLESNGFRFSQYALDGCRILKIPAGGSGYFMPYMDNASGAEHWDDDYFMCGYGDVSTQSTSGVTGGVTCYHCDEVVGEDDVAGYTEDGDPICNGCYDDGHYVSCADADGLVHCDDVSYVERYHEYYLSQNCTYSHQLNEYVLDDESVTVRGRRGYEDVAWNDSDEIVYSDTLDEYYWSDEAVEVKIDSDGTTDWFRDDDEDVVVDVVSGEMIYAPNANHVNGYTMETE